MPRPAHRDRPHLNAHLNGLQAKRHRLLAAAFASAKDQAENGAGRIGAELDIGIIDPADQIDAAVGGGRVGIDRGLSAVKFLPHRFELGVAEPLVAVACHATDAINFERIKGIGDFFQALIDVREREHGERAKPALVIALELLAILV